MKNIPIGISHFALLIAHFSIKEARRQGDRKTWNLEFGIWNLEFGIRSVSLADGISS
jgi:hypothetical protein